MAVRAGAGADLRGAGSAHLCAAPAHSASTVALTHAYQHQYGNFYANQYGNFYANQYGNANPHAHCDAHQAARAAHGDVHAGQST
jgi:hypothetical protein